MSINKNTINPVILCGGAGSRLWPLSRSGFPKQFLALSGDGSNMSLFQQAIERINNLNIPNVELGKTLVVTNEEHRFLVLDQLRGLVDIHATLLLEPDGRNTAPALTLAALQASGSERVGDPILVITPADQTVIDIAAFSQALKNCVAVVVADSADETIAILGVTPTSAETGYGYIKRSSNSGVYGEHDVEKFVEKPDLETAQRYLKEGDYLWNSGMFVLRASTWLATLKEFRLDICSGVAAAWAAKTEDRSEDTLFLRPDKNIFQAIPSESIDYAVIEKCPGSRFAIKMVELDAGWSDLGSWDAVWQAGSHDEDGNVSSGDTLLTDTSNTLVHASSRLVSTVGVKDLIVIETADAVLVADRSSSQNVKKIVGALDRQGREERNLHRKVARPWGWYDSVDEGDRFKVKRIQVKPRASLSLQKHHHRAEHWIVVRGVAEVTNGEEIIRLTENQSTYIPKGQTHRLTNPGDIPLEIIEVQTGDYLGEDDIVRLEDSYGRVV
jgi:mannose-1-phosphate guanylyltransferase/mannose-6-phosphate isomerase